jgi:hypothetical protein
LVGSYDQLREVLRRRVEELGITFDTVDEVGGLPSTSSWAGRHWSPMPAGVLTADRVPANAPNLSELDDEIRKTRANLDQFVSDASNTMNEIIASQNEHLQELIATRERIEQRRTMSRFLFDDLVRASMQEYLQTGDQGVLKKNLDTIRAMVPKPLPRQSP